MSTEPLFAINGRFLTQPMTGVQRYAQNVLVAMDPALSMLNVKAPIIAPSSAVDPGLSAMPFAGAGPFVGHPWEQFVLPARWSGRLLNLCNTAPVIKENQVVCIHDANVFVAPQSYGTVFRLLYKSFQPLLARRSLRIATVSKNAARQIAQYLPVHLSDIVVLPNGHEHVLTWDPALAQVAPSIVSGPRIKPARGFILALGSRAQHKNLRLLLNAAPGFAEIGLEVVVVGGGAGIFTSETLQAVPNVHVIGSVTDHDLAFLMDRAVCLAFPSWTEGFGLPILEAMARGCPVISSDRASMPEVCGNAALLAPPDNPEAWVQHVRILLESSDLRQELIERGRERARSYSWANTAAGYIELMREPSACIRSQDAAQQTYPNVAVIIATRGRPETVTATLRRLIETQTLKPTTVIVSCVDPEDAGDAAILPGVRLIVGRPGSSAQRNAALAALPQETEIVAFLDDDFVADARWLAAAAQVFRDNPHVAGFTGHVLVDGIKGPGLSFAEAVQIVETSEIQAGWTTIEPYSPYGCNMAFRFSMVADLRFDERLVLYGWLEDRDFAARVAKRGGRLVKCASARGVHMGIKTSRVAGERFGYSQVVNPFYMLQKGTMSAGQVADHVFRNIASNVARAMKPEPFIDRRGRLRGNLIGLADVLRGRLHPERAAAIQPRQGV
jgi:glycosyltransferase involved in cell wall biosynthesis/GT2 family glycosyltransferase